MPHDKGSVFRALHKPGDPFVLANAWDAGSARMLVGLGAKAIGTSSAAHAFTLGRPDFGHLTRDEALAHVQSLVAAVNCPVSADLENGFGDAPDYVAETIAMAAECGAAGVSIEDIAPPDETAYPFDLAVERIRAGVARARSLPGDLMICARADGVMYGVYDMEEALRRSLAYCEAGADCIYVPMPPSLAELQRLCAAVDRPVNALVAGHFTQHRFQEFAEVGVARISLGSSLARATHKVILDAATAMMNDGDFSLLKADVSDTVDALLADGTPRA